MALPLFPESPAPLWPYTFEAEYKTIISPVESNLEQAIAQWRFPKRYVELLYDPGISREDFSTLYDFFTGRRGRYLAFYFYDWVTGDWADEFVGWTDGATQTWDLPGRSASSRKAYFDGSQKYPTWSTGTGDAGADQMTFSWVPAAGKLITASFTGQLRLRMRFEDDKITREDFYTTLVRTGLRLRERRSGA